MSKVVRIRADLVAELEKKFSGKPLGDAVDEALRSYLKLPAVARRTPPDVTKALVDVTRSLEDVTTRLGRVERWLETYGEKWELLCKLIDLHYKTLHRYRELPDEVAELLEGIREGL